MGITYTNNSQSISTTEYSLPNASTTLTPQTTKAVFQFFINFRNMIAGDQYRIRLYEKHDSGGTQSIVEEWILTGVQSKPMFITPSFVLGQGWDVTVTRLAGADRTIDWSIRAVS